MANLNPFIPYTIPADLTFADLQYRREPDGQIRASWTTVTRVCEASDIDPGDFHSSLGEDALERLVAQWYGHARDRGEPLNLLAEELLAEIAAGRMPRRVMSEVFPASEHRRLAQLRSDDPDRSLSERWKLVCTAHPEFAASRLDFVPVVIDRGWAVLTFVDEGFAYTVGLSYRYDHPELLMSIKGRSMEEVGRMLNQLADAVARGERIVSGEPMRLADPDLVLTFHDYDEAAFDRFPTGLLGDFEEVFNDRAFSKSSAGMLPVLWATFPASERQVRRASDDARRRLPRPLQLAMALCDHAHLRLLRDDEPDRDFVHDGVSTTAWPFETDAGWMYLVETGGRAILFRRDTRQRVCELASSVIERPTTATLDNDTRASNPGSVPVQAVRWFSHYPEKARGPLVRAAICVAVGVVAAPWLWGITLVSLVVALAMLEPMTTELRRVRDQFRHGCANPAVIVALDPMLIAVATDLTKGEVPCPVVKIIQKELATAAGCKPEIGTRLCTVSVYIPGRDPARWETFDPRPIDCATADQDVIDRTMRTFPASDWEELDAWIAQVPKPLKAGQYLITEPERQPA